jgi:hypothetical protein
MLSGIILDFDGLPEALSAESLYDYTGSKDFGTVRSLEATLDASDSSLAFMGDLFPNLAKLRLNNSVIPSLRDIGCTLTSLRFLSIANSGIVSLDGISTISRCLEELHLAFNAIKDVSYLLGMHRLKILDLEGNQVGDVASVELLGCCTGLRSLTLSGNPVAKVDGYAEIVAKHIPNLEYLDEMPVTQSIRIAVQIAGNQIVTPWIDDRARDRPPSARAVVFKVIPGKASPLKRVPIIRPVSSGRIRIAVT